MACSKCKSGDRQVYPCYGAAPKSKDDWESCNFIEDKEMRYRGVYTHCPVCGDSRYGKKLGENQILINGSIYQRVG